MALNYSNSTGQSVFSFIELIRNQSSLQVSWVEAFCVLYWACFGGGEGFAGPDAWNTLGIVISSGLWRIWIRPQEDCCSFFLKIPCKAQPAGEMWLELGREICSPEHNKYFDGILSLSSSIRHIIVCRPIDVLIPHALKSGTMPMMIRDFNLRYSAGGGIWKWKFYDT